MTIYDHIHRLRAELAGGYLASPQERAIIKAELDRDNATAGRD
jgi:hypothetical protein